MWYTCYAEICMEYVRLITRSVCNPTTLEILSNDCVSSCRCLLRDGRACAERINSVSLSALIQGILFKIAMADNTQKL